MDNSETLPDFTVRHGVDLNECLEDSPDFRCVDLSLWYVRLLMFVLCREHLEEHEKEINDLETGLERVRKLKL